MNYEELIDLGLNKNEAIVFTALAKFGESDANSLIKETKFHKNIVYDNLEKLIDKGLATFIIEDGIRKYSVSQADAIVHYIEEEQDILSNKKKKAEAIAKQIKSLSKLQKHTQTATIYRGIKSIKSYYASTLEGGDYVVFGSPKESVELMGPSYWENYTLKRKEKKLSVKMIFNSSIRKHGEKIKNKFTDIRYFPKHFDPLAETLVQGDTVAITVWTREPLLFLIKDKKVAETYLKYFEDMWKNSEK